MGLVEYLDKGLLELGICRHCIRMFETGVACAALQHRVEAVLSEALINCIQVACHLTHIRPEGSSEIFAPIPCGLGYVLVLDVVEGLLTFKFSL